MSAISKARAFCLLWTERAFILPPVREWDMSRDDTEAEWGERCEVCGGTDVMRAGEWDYCSAGHAYVGKRAER